MTTTIKVSNETKQLLDMLQAKMTLISRKKKTLTELIDTITRIALRHENELMETENLPPLEKDPAMKPSLDWRVKTDASKVDEYIYTED
ncbi:MAG: hypothetical protein FIB07_07835 [Candidatus Methanoperedens sp.]|nr:hypothetical protein [Candidatus Methanoperedens sp.]